MYVFLGCARAISDLAPRSLAEALKYPETKGRSLAVLPMDWQE